MRKARLFYQARKRHSAVYWGIAGFAVATVALFAAPDMASTLGRSTQLRVAEPKLTQISCADFDNQAEAQAFLAAHAVSDIQPLDADKDGLVCEQLP